MKLTKWFPANINPAYPGVYEIKSPNSTWTWYRRWNGNFWFVGGSTPEDAASSKWRIHKDTSKWRGLAEPPKGWTK
jgi:hypothetical protein